MNYRVARLEKLLLLAMVCVTLVSPAAFAQTGDVDEVFGLIEARVEAEYPSLKELYMHLHTHPELSYHESESADRMAEELGRVGFEVTQGVGGHGVVAVMKNGEGPTLMIRGDMDALPLKEETGRPYASTVVVKDDLGRDVNVMHACGHDIHMTSLIGTGRVLSALKENWRGTLVLIAQPAEERGGGASAMLGDGLYTRFPSPDVALALHVNAQLPSGSVGYVKGYSTANVDSVDIKIRGVGGHGAYPHMTKDPVLLAAEVVVALQSIVSREVAPQDPVVVTVGSIHGGTKHNIIPNEVDLQLTVRTYSDETRAQVLAAIERIAMNVARMAGVPDGRLPIVTLKEEFTPSGYNDPELVERGIGIFRDLLGEDKVVQGEPTMGGEDFARYGRQEPRIPIFMYSLGSISADRMAEAEREGGTPLPSLHSSKYFPDMEPTIKTGVKTMSAIALDILK
ncbi:MAG: amidohydrolase [Candidatus Hydrogenedentes bacterium]|nr:amidohydrolase [Candidatus Hydrogenedentota bacterium]